MRILMVIVFLFCANLLCGDSLAAAQDTPPAQMERVFEDPLFSRWQERQARREAPIPPGLFPELNIDGSGFRKAIGEVLGKIWRSLFPSGPARTSNATPGSPSGSGIGGALKVAAIVISVIVGVVVIVLVVAAGKHFIHRRVAAPVLPIDEALETGDALAATSEAWLEHADDLAGREDLRLAFRAMYLALLSGLHREGLINFNKRRTNWTYVRQFKGEEDHRRRLEQLTDGFDASWYGLRLPSRHEFEQMRAVTSSLLGEQSP